MADTLKNPDLNVSRVAVYAHKDVVVEVRNDLMTDDVSSIWLEVGLKRQKKFLVSNIYREWKYLEQLTDESGLVTAQLARWKTFLQKWEEAISSNLEIHVLGDINLNFLDFYKQTSVAGSNSNRLRPLIQALLDCVVPYGFTQLIMEVTRICQHHTPSLLDHFWTNKPENVSNVQAIVQGGSDHKVIFAVRHTKKKVCKEK